jgi:hypothetical protein
MTDHDELCVICLSHIEPEVTDVENVEVVVITETQHGDADAGADAGGGFFFGCTCKYTVHPECIRKWYRYRPVCPICRNAVAVAVAVAVATDDDDGTLNENIAGTAMHARMGRTIGGSIILSTFFVWLLWFMAVQPNVQNQSDGH